LVADTNCDPEIDPCGDRQPSFVSPGQCPKFPHEYVVRSPDSEAAYVALFNAIMEHGVCERWAGRDKRYLYPGDGWRY